MVHKKVIHEGRRDFECPTCGWSFRSKDGLMVHKKVVHEGRRDFECPTCGKSFGEKRARDMHIKVVHNVGATPDGQNGRLREKNGRNSGEEGSKQSSVDKKIVFNCQQCAEVFLRKIDLLRHIQQHHYKKTGEKETRCDLCGKKLSNVPNIWRHQAWRCERRVSCKWCGKDLSNVCNRKRHEDKCPEKGSLFEWNKW